MVRRHPDVAKFGEKIYMGDIESDPVIRFQHKWEKKSDGEKVKKRTSKWNNQWLQIFCATGNFAVFCAARLCLHINWNDSARSYSGTNATSCSVCAHNRIDQLIRTSLWWSAVWQVRNIRKQKNYQQLLTEWNVKFLQKYQAHRHTDNGRSGTRRRLAQLSSCFPMGLSFSWSSIFVKCKHIVHSLFRMAWLGEWL